jgi:hypothetical protein
MSLDYDIDITLGNEYLFLGITMASQENYGYEFRMTTSDVHGFILLFHPILTFRNLDFLRSSLISI